jgi:hypothetical protein
MGKTWEDDEEDDGITQSSLPIVYARECGLLEAIFVELVGW